MPRGASAMIGHNPEISTEGRRLLRHCSIDQMTLIEDAPQEGSGRPRRDCWWPCGLCRGLRASSVQILPSNVCATGGRLRPPDLRRDRRLLRSASPFDVSWLAVNRVCIPAPDSATTGSSARHRIAGAAPVLAKTMSCCPAVFQHRLVPP